MDNNENKVTNENVQENVAETVEETAVETTETVEEAAVETTRTVEETATEATQADNVETVKAAAEVEVETVKATVETSEKNYDGLSLASMIIGIVSLVLSLCCCTWIALGLSIVGIILGALGKKCGFKTAGLVLNIIAVSWAVISIIILLVLGVGLSPDPNNVKDAFDNIR